ncbi:MAG: RNA-binding protein [Gammaproteobacteria bacterium]|nr:MAG: RNA-binding protein [Gammaproteobacteria bacterium]TND04776.1 MAG: RNA-binding protein [Gammaproteobacteria bacterium]
MSLSTKQKTHLRSLCHHLNPVVIVGDAGITPGVLAEITAAIAYHELVKIRLPAGDHTARRQLIDQVCTETDAVLVQTIGRTATFYRRGKKPRIVLPA